MKRWGIGLVVGAVLLLVVDGDDCPLNGMEEHAWLIRITPMKKKDDSSGHVGVGGEGDSKIFQFYRGNDGRAAGNKRNRYRRFKREDDTPPGSTPIPGLDDDESEGAAPESPDEKPISSPERDDDEEQEWSPEGQQNKEEQPDPEPGESVMHGALISPAMVLTTTYNEYEWMFISPMQTGFLSLVGYNTAKKCMQEQWAKEAQYHTNAAENSLNAGEFAIIHSHDPFLVEADPFLFGPSGLPPVSDIIRSYNTLVSNPEARVMMYLFKNPKNKADGSIYDIAKTSFKFIPWRLCQEMDSLMTAGGKGMSAQVSAETFFCSMGIPGIINETLGGPTTGYGNDWYQGAPVLFGRDDLDKIPMGHYVYRVGKTGDPRIYATYTSKLSKWLQSPSIIGERTLPPPDPEELTVANEGLPTKQAAQSGGDSKLGRGRRKGPGRASSHQIRIAGPWILMICASATTILFADKL